MENGTESCENQCLLKTDLSSNEGLAGELAFVSHDKMAEPWTSTSPINSLMINWTCLSLSHTNTNFRVVCEKLEFLMNIHNTRSIKYRHSEDPRVARQPLITKQSYIMGEVTAINKLHVWTPLSRIDEPQDGSP